MKSNPFVPTTELVRDAVMSGYAIPSFCVWSSDIMYAVLSTAHELRAPVMLMSGGEEFDLLPIPAMAETARACMKLFSVSAALHLDHGDSPAQAIECIECGYTSVMVDYSRKPIEENIDVLGEVVRHARPKGVSVEGEIGAVGRTSDSNEADVKSTLTDPEEAKRLSAETGIDLLAVSFGNAHGTYTAKPTFQFGLLERIAQSVNLPLVLHGGSGTPEPDLKRAISLGIRKVNVATELKQAVHHELSEDCRSDRRRNINLALAAARPALTEVIAKWCTLTGAAGRA